MVVGIQVKDGRCRLLRITNLHTHLNYGLSQVHLRRTKSDVPYSQADHQFKFRYSFGDTP